MHTIPINPTITIHAEFLADAGRWILWYELAGHELDVDPYWAWSWALS